MPRQADTPHDLRLGLIGDNIAASRSPLLHRLAGDQCGLSVSYERLIPRELGKDFDAVFADCQASGYRGLNITYPYKERVVAKVSIDDPLVRAIGAVNTVIFDQGTAAGHNTDYSGFKAAYENCRGNTPPGTVLMIGTGGVGRAIAFALVALGARAIRLMDRDEAKAETLAKALRAAVPELDVSVWPDAETAANGAQGLINCTPVGMVGYPGSPLSKAAMAHADWAFDAVYTPQNTQFLTDAQAQGLSVISGWELFFYQGVHAWGFFSGTPLDEADLRSRLISLGDAA